MKVMKFLTIALLAFVMAACGGSDEASKVASKISADEQLNEADYRVMIDYCGKYAREAQKIQDEINALPVDSEESGKLNDEMVKLTDKYSYAQIFSDKISNCTKEEVGTANVALINEYAPLMWFSAPEWATIGDDSGVAGFIEDMPSADSTGVISTGDGVAVDSVAK